MIYIIIPVFNRKAYTRGCLLCLRKQTYRAFKTIVVDDGSTDGTTEMLATDFPEVTVLRGDGNLWWTKAINWGVRHILEQSTNVSEDAILTLNDDLTIEPDYLASLMESYQANQPCLVGSVVVDIKNPDYLEYAGTSCNYYTAKWTHNSASFGNDYQQLKAKHRTLPTDSLSGRGTMIPLAVFRQIGLYDEVHCPHYVADLELSVRAKRAGYKLLVSVDSPVHNYLEATRNKRQPWQEFVRGFGSFKSPNYLRARYAFAIRHAPTKQLYFLLDLGRVTAGYVLGR